MAVVALVVAVASIVLNVRQYRAALTRLAAPGHAELVVELHELHSRGAAPDLFVLGVRNDGQASAFWPEAWVGDIRRRPLTLPYPGLDPVVEVGATALIRGDFPHQTGLEEMRLFIGWEDARGQQVRYTGLRF